MLRKIQKYDYKEVEMLYESSGFETINQIFEFKHMLAHSYVKDLIRVKWLDCKLLEAAKYENLLIQDIKAEINYFAELRNRLKQGTNI